LLSERLVGRFYRTFTFLNDVKEEAIKAALKDGVLDLQILKKEEIDDIEKARRILTDEY
jgi:HSP20 family molecular chaperone IbpA